MSMGEGDMEMVNTYDLSLLQHAWVQGGRCQKRSDSNRDFLPNSISPNTELTGGEGIGSSKSPYTASVPQTFDALENRVLFGTLWEKDGTQLLRGGQKYD